MNKNSFDQIKNELDKTTAITNSDKFSSLKKGLMTAFFITLIAISIILMILLTSRKRTN